jgi:hypothetical protein
MFIVRSCIAEEAHRETALRCLVTTRREVPSRRVELGFDLHSSTFARYQFVPMIIFAAANATQRS